MPAPIATSYFPINIYLINAQIKGKFSQETASQTKALPTVFFSSIPFVNHTPMPQTPMKFS